PRGRGDRGGRRRAQGRRHRRPEPRPRAGGRRTDPGGRPAPHAPARRPGRGTRRFGVPRRPAGPEHRDPRTARRPPRSGARPGPAHHRLPHRTRRFPLRGAAPGRQRHRRPPLRRPETPGPRMTHDLRLVLPALATWLTAATTIALPPLAVHAVAAVTLLTALPLLTRAPATPHNPTPPPPSAGAAGAGAAGGRRRAGGRGRLGGVVLVCAAASAAGVGLRATAVSTGPVRDLARNGGFATAEAVVTGDPRAKPGGGRQVIILRARAEAVPGAEVRVPVLLIASDPGWLRLVPSQRVRLHGRFVTPEGADLLAAVVIVRGPPAVLGPPSRTQRAAEHVRARLRAAVARLPPDQRGVLPGMVVG